MRCRTIEESFAAGYRDGQKDRMTDAQRAKLIALLRPYLDVLFGDEDNRDT